MRLELPLFQNWSCHRCTCCCRDHIVELTAEEHQRIRSLGWTAADGLSTDQPFFVPIGSAGGTGRWRLTHRADNACIFLDADGRCRIHRRFGADAKPRACRIFPFAFHPAGNRVAVSLRFSCPSVAANRGEPLPQQVNALKELARLALPPEAEPVRAPPVLDKARIAWPDFHRYVRHLDAFLAAPDHPTDLKLRHALAWLKLIAKGHFDRVVGDSAEDILRPLAEAAPGKTAGDSSAASPPGRISRVFFRLVVAQYARKDLPSDLSARGRYRWHLFRAVVGFAWGSGSIRPLQSVFRPAPFAEVEKPFGNLPSGGEELLTRYFRVKIQGLHFCGPAYYDLPLVEGFHHLALIYPVILWLARWLAVGDGRAALTLDDLTRATAIADHNHGHSPGLATASSRQRVRMLVQTGDLPRLCTWYRR